MFKGTKKFTLLYQGSRDGFSNKAHANSINGKGATLHVIKTKDGAIFGFYTSLSWRDKSQGWMKDPEGTQRFYFKDGKILANPYKPNPRSKEHIYFSTDFIFNSYDFRVGKNCNTAWK